MRSARLLVFGLLVAVLAPRAAHAQSDAPDLDRLLKLPDSIEYSSESKAGRTRNEWRQRFVDARGDLANAEKALDKAQRDLKETVGAKSEWQLSPPGLPANTSASPEDSSSAFQLRQEVKRQRGEVDRARNRLRELDVEANLAGVPEEWRGPSTSAGSNDATGDDSGTRSQARP